MIIGLGGGGFAHVRLALEAALPEAELVDLPAGEPIAHRVD